MLSDLDILILSNGPGEVTTWVRPAVRALREHLGDDRSRVRISVVLSPCPNATGKEEKIARTYSEVDRVLSPEHFFSLLIWGRTPQKWDWRHKGAVLFLGGDQFYCLLLGKRLGYATVVYAEWDARWYRQIDRFAVTKEAIAAKVPKKYRHKCIVVGDLMADTGIDNRDRANDREIIGLLPGSKPAKLAQGVPLCLAIAEKIYHLRPQTQFIILVAPTLDLQALAEYADPQKNPLLAKVGGASAKLVIPDSDSFEGPFLRTSSGVEIQLISTFPAREFLCRCCLCFTTVGANTAELGALGIPMIVLLPTQQLDAMRSWDGIPGILANLPGFGSVFAKAINWTIIRQGRLFAWPNIWAKREIVPELVGNLQPASVAQIAIDLLNNRDRLKQISEALASVCGKPGAASRIASIVADLLIQ